MAVNTNSIPLLRVMFIRSLFPDLKISAKAALRLDAIIERIVLRPIAHETLPTAIFIHWKLIRRACCGNQTLEKKIKARVLVRVPGYKRQSHVGDAYHVNPVFRANYIAASRAYNPVRGSGIEVHHEINEHPFCSMVPVNLPYMQLAFSELERWVKYLARSTKTKPKNLRSIIEPVCEKEKRKVWSGEFAEGSVNHKHCPLRSSPRERSQAKVENIQAGLTTMIDIALNNDGCIPMNYRPSDNCPRWYSTGGMRSLQSCPKAVEEICMHGGTEYDIISTNQTIALQYAIDNNLPHGALLSLVENKSECYSELMGSTSLRQDTLKTTLLTLGNKGRLVKPDHARKLIWKLRFNQEAGRALSVPNAVLGAIWEESRYRVDVFLSRYSALYGNAFIQKYVEEMVAIERHVKYNGKGKSFSSYAYEVEVAAMMAMYQAMPSARISKFDAVVCAHAEDFESAELVMYDATGVPFKLKEIPYD